MNVTELHSMPFQSSKTALRAAMRSALDSLPCPLEDEEDRLALETHVGNHLDYTLLIPSSPPALYGAALVCPFYAGESLAAYAKYLDSIEPAGVRALHLMAVDSTNQALLDFGGTRDLSVWPPSDRSKFWQRALSANNSRRALSFSSGKTLSDTTGASPDFDSWFSALKPALELAMKALAPSMVRKNIRHLEKAIAAPVTDMVKAAVHEIVSAFTPGLERELVNLAGSSPIPTFGTYNFLAGPPAVGSEAEFAKQTRVKTLTEFVRRNRTQSLVALRNLSGVLGRFSMAIGFEDSLRSAVDRGERIGDFLTQHFAARGNQVKSFLNAKLDLSFGRASEYDENWIGNYFRLLDQIPPECYPKNDDDIRIALRMSMATDVVHSISVDSGRDPQQLWGDLLKDGWERSARFMAGFQIEEPPLSEDPNAPPVKKIYPSDPVDLGTLAGQTLAELSWFTQFARTLHTLQAKYVSDYVPGPAEAARFRGYIPRPTADEVSRLLLANKTLKGLADLIPQLRDIITDAEAAAVVAADGVPARAEWSPMLPNTPDVVIGNVRIVELVNSAELQLETDHLKHCVNGYGANCMTNGFRIFSFMAGQARGDNLSERATLSLVINPDCDRFRTDQFLGYRNNMAGEDRVIRLELSPELRRARDRFIEMLRSNELPPDLDGFRRDRLRNFERLNATAASDGARFRVMDRAAAFLMPRPARDHCFTQWLHSDLFEAGIGILREVVQPPEEDNALEMR